MYLKTLEITGFKSFANKTILDFGRGMTAVVGPNGCGKSNVSDAIRWVLGEQSAKALRGSKMGDVIFNGTDSSKPLNMAEVSITLAECEDRLGTDFNEVNVTRRVFRSGESQYFINKSACRLKDIQRLFMDTGIGRNSYSIMEQGRIDMILSSRPEDRRAVFEEASGITKFKSDKKETLRKLSQTDGNLMRLEDIIREVSRQIRSLERQAEKAKRYQAIKDELRDMDLFHSQRRLKAMREERATAEKRAEELGTELETVKKQVETVEADSEGARETLNATEEQIAQAMELSVQAKTDLESTQNLITVNEERIQELKTYASRDTKDAKEAETRLGQHKENLETLRKGLGTLATDRDSAEKAFKDAQAKVDDAEGTLNESRKRVQELRARLIGAEQEIAKGQLELAKLADSEKESIAKRQRLEAEHQQSEQRQVDLVQRFDAMASGLTKLETEVASKQDVLNSLLVSRTEKESRLQKLRQEISEFQQQLAAKNAALELILKQEASAEEFPAGARLLLDPKDLPEVDPAGIFGPVAHKLKAKPGYQRALESCLRTWMDTIVVKDPQTMRGLLEALEHHSNGSARMISAQADAPPRIDMAGERLIDHIDSESDAQNIAEILFANVIVVEDSKAVPADIPFGITVVTKTGTLIRGNGSSEFYSTEDQAGNPLAMRHLKTEIEESLLELNENLTLRRQAVDTLQSEEENSVQMIQRARTELEESKNKFAQQQGERQSLNSQAMQAKNSFEKAAKLLAQLAAVSSPGDEKRQAVSNRLATARSQQAEMRSAIQEQEGLLQKIELSRSHQASDASEKRVAFAELQQRLNSQKQQLEPAEQRIRELEGLIANRSQGVQGYETRVQALKNQIEEAKEKLDPLHKEFETQNKQLEEHRKRRQKQTEELQQSERGLRENRQKLDKWQQEKNSLDIKLAESNVREQAIYERIEEEYQLSNMDFDRLGEPDWGDKGQPDDQSLETQVNAMKARLDKMGPVNLVAIEEHRELEDRHQFLLQQQEDLVNSKKELEEMIRKINKTTEEMFMETFNKVNENFQVMFKKLFGGGIAELKLMDAEDALDSGIEIVARPPGKKPQTISLLSGGERTMTAVSLLFSLYQVKPSPFCFLDELDAALDDANIGRFVDALQMFVKDSQFVVITHNRRTIDAAGALYGVTMQEKGISKVVSVKLSDYEGLAVQGAIK